jgi:hypothetical protein
VLPTDEEREPEDAICPMSEDAGAAEGVYEARCTRIGSLSNDAEAEAYVGARGAERRDAKLPEDPSQGVWEAPSLPIDFDDMLDVWIPESDLWSLGE